MTVPLLHIFNKAYQQHYIEAHGDLKQNIMVSMVALKIWSTWSISLNEEKDPVYCKIDFLLQYNKFDIKWQSWNSSLSLKVYYCNRKVDRDWNFFLVTRALVTKPNRSTCSNQRKYKNKHKTKLPTKINSCKCENIVSIEK